jgi:transcription-repair coupling factor (superfamily II helicase)
VDVNGRLQEAVRIIYKDSDLLYVNINSLHKISKFTGKEGSIPKISKIGSDAWAKLKEKTKVKVKEIAFDLIKLYAARKSQQGFQHAPDNYMQTELEASFIWKIPAQWTDWFVAMWALAKQKSPFVRHSKLVWMASRLLC